MSDSSSGAIGSAVRNALGEVVQILAEVTVPAEQRQAWLERLWEALLADQVPYIEYLDDRWFSAG